MSQPDDVSDLGTLFKEQQQPEAESPLVDFVFPHSGPGGDLNLTKSTKQHSLWGNMVWNGARYLAQQMENKEIDLSGKTVLELGAGLGVPSLIAARHGARSVVATDYPEDCVMDLLERNVKQNISSQQPAKEGGESVSEPIQHKVSCQPLLWGDEEQEDKALSLVGGNGYDVLILSDVVFNHVCHSALVKSLRRCLSKDPRAVAYVVFTHYRPQKKEDDLRFFDLLAAAGLEYRKVREERCPVMFPEDSGDEVDRSTVHHYEVKHTFDAAGAPLDENTYDVVVLGTGLVESITSAAASRSGLKVLHLDSAGYYGGCSFTGNVPQFLTHLKSNYAATANIIFESSDAATFTRDYSLDTLPMLHLASGDLINKLMQSNTAKYLEFQNMDRLVTITPSTSESEEGAGKQSVRLSRVPLNRSDVFKHCKWLSPLEMRQLMKLVAELEKRLQEAADSDDANEKQEPATITGPATFYELLKTKFKLSKRSIELITLHGQLVSPTMGCNEGFKTVGQFMASVGRFEGQTPFLTTQYGGAELPQNMSRVSAVWGGIFVLQRGVTKVVDNADTNGAATPIAVTLSNGQQVKAKHFIAPRTDLTTTGPAGRATASRVVVVARKPLVSWGMLEEQNDDTPEGEDEATQRQQWVVPSIVGVVPAQEGLTDAAVTFIQFGAVTQHCPRSDHCVLHFSADNRLVSQSQIETLVNRLIVNTQDDSVTTPLSKDDVILVASFVVGETNQTPAVEVEYCGSQPSSSRVVGVQSFYLGYDDGSYTQEARRAFDIVHNNAERRAKVAAAAAVEAEGGEESNTGDATAVLGKEDKPVEFLEFIPDHASQVNFVEHDEDARVLGVEG